MRRRCQAILRLVQAARLLYNVSDRNERKADQLMQPGNQSAGLFFSGEDLRLARENLDREPIRSAAALLDSPKDDPLAAAQLQALRYQFHEDTVSGRLAIAALVESSFASETGNDLDALKRSLSWLSTMAMLRDHPDWLPVQDEQLAAIPAMLSRLHQSDESSDPLNQLWQATVTMAAGILLEKDDDFERAAAVYRHAVDNDIHPEGYLKGIVDKEGARQSYAMQVSGVCALVLMAEMAGQVGVDLWSHHSRAVSVVTAATYSIYYYFFPEGWRWEAGLTPEQTDEIIRREGAFLEMAHRRHPLRGIELLFTEQRPLFSPYGGGLTSLTHSLLPASKKRWRLW